MVKTTGKITEFTQYTLPDNADRVYDTPIDIPADGLAVVSNGDIRSGRYAKGKRGWRLRDDGTAEFRNINIGTNILSIDSTGSITDSIRQLEDVGGGTINLQRGTYIVNTTITGLNAVRIIGEDAASTIINFTGSAGISFAGTNVYSTGTITSITSGVNVTGSGTSWLANVTAGQHLFLGTRWYKIAAVTGNTTLVLAEGYGDNVTLPSAYRIATVIRGAELKNLTLTGSSGTAISFTDARQCDIDNVICYANNKGMVLTNVSEFAATQFIAVSNTSNGCELTNCGLFDWGSINLISNGGAGMVMNNVKDALISPGIAAGNTGDGYNITTGVNLTLLLDSSGNGGQGVELAATNDEINLLNPRIIGNTSDGIKLTATSDNCRITAGQISYNGGYGVNVAASTDDFTNIVGNVFTGNATSAVNDSGTSTVIRGNNGVSDNGTYGSFVNAYQATFSESASAGDALSIGSGTSYVLDTNASASAGIAVGGVGNSDWVSQGFTTSSNSISIPSAQVTFSNANGAGPTYAYAASIRADNGSGLPTGADLGSGTATANATPAAFTGYTLTFTWGTPITVSPSTKYHLVIRGTNGQTNQSVNRANNASVDTGSSSNSGTSWSASNGKIQYSISEIDSVSGQIFKSSATGSTNRQNFIGFAPAAVSASAVGTAYVSGVMTGLSGLSPGAQYYLSDTKGAISTTPGMVSKKVGIALSATSLLILNN